MLLSPTFSVAQADSPLAGPVRVSAGGILREAFCCVWPKESLISDAGAEVSLASVVAIASSVVRAYAPTFRGPLA